MQFKDKVVIVTGGAQGIGKCIADEFRKEGAYVDQTNDLSRRTWLDVERAIDRT